MSTFTRTFIRDDGVTQIDVDFEVTSWGSPAVTSGPPESCDMGDPMEAEITGAVLSEGGAKVDDLTDAERERFEMTFLEDPPEYDDEPDWDWE